MAKEEKEIEGVKVPLKTVVIIIVAIIGWILPAAGVYYNMASKLDAAVKDNVEVKELLSKYDLKLLDYKLSNLEIKVNETNTLAADIKQLLNNQ